MQNLTVAVMKESALMEQIADTKRQYEQTMNRLVRELKDAQRLVNILKNGVDEGKYELALSIMKLNTKYMGGEAKEVIQRAIDDIANGCPLLKSRYFGTKNYDRWTGQAFTCSYGYGPSHGYEVFSIALKADARKRCLTDEETEACIYTLLQLVDGKIPEMA